MGTLNIIVKPQTDEEREFEEALANLVARSMNYEESPVKAPDHAEIRDDMYIAARVCMDLFRKAKGGES